MPRPQFIILSALWFLVSLVPDRFLLRFVSAWHTRLGFDLDMEG